MKLDDVERLVPSFDPHTLIKWHLVSGAGEVQGVR
jgi:hypothetical protein